MKQVTRISALVLLLVLLSASFVVQAQQPPPVCRDFDPDPFDVFLASCGDALPGQLCYGYDSIVAYANFRRTIAINNFDVGDNLGLRWVEMVQGEGFDSNPPAPAERPTWGLSLITLANVNDPTPARPFNGDGDPNLRYILFGDTDIMKVDERPSEGFSPMQSFTYRTTDTTPVCVDAPSALLVQSDCATEQRDFRVEGADMTIDGAAVFTGGIPSGAQSGVMQVYVIYGVLTIQPDRNADGTPPDQTEPIIVPAGYTTSAPLTITDTNQQIDLDSENHVGQWQPIRPMTQQELDELAYLEEIPRNLGYCPIDIPVIVQASGTGGPLPELFFDSSAPLAAVLPYCQVANPPAFCAYLRLP